MSRKVACAFFSARCLRIGLVVLLLADSVGCKKVDRLAAQKLSLEWMSTRCMQFRNYHGEFPSKLLDLIDDSIFDVEHDDLLDEWGNRLLYEMQDKGFRLRSKGPDGMLGTADDLIHVQGRFA